MEEEEYEHIPWSALVAEQEAPNRRRMTYLAAAVVASLAVGAAGVRLVRSAPGTTAELPIESTAEAPSTTAQDASPPLAAVEPVAPVETAEAPPPRVPAIYSEADLMATAPTVEERLAVTRAEWFVFDYFTADLEPAASGSIREVLPEGMELPDLLQDQDAPTGVSYVEWARAFDVELLNAGVYAVDVAFRMLGAPADAGFSRLPARAVRIVVGIDDLGDQTVLDLPIPIPPPFPGALEGWPGSDRHAPQGILDTALLAGNGWGDDPEIVESGGAPGGWRVVITAADEADNRWPLVLWLDDDGGFVRAPPWQE